MDEHPRAPRDTYRNMYHIADDMDTETHDVEENEGNVQLNKEDFDAAQTLLKLHREGTFALRRLVNENDGKVDRAVTKLLLHACQHPLGSAKTAGAASRHERNRLKKKDIDAALTLVKLSGQSRAPSKAALALLHLRRECMVILHHDKQKQTPLARRAVDEQNAAEHFEAVTRFRKQYPAVLRTSSRRDGRMLRMPDDPFALLE